jgi:hypothetical protein
MPIQYPTAPILGVEARTRHTERTLRVDGNLVPDPAILNAARGARPDRAEATTSRRTDGKTRGSDTAPEIKNHVLRVKEDREAVKLTDKVSDAFAKDPDAAFGAQANVRPHHALVLLSR